MKTKTEIKGLVLKGYTNEEIAQTTGFSFGEVRRFISKIFKEYNATSRVTFANEVYNRHILKRLDVMIVHCPNCLSYKLRKSQNYKENYLLICIRCGIRFPSPTVVNGKDFFSLDNLNL